MNDINYNSFEYETIKGKKTFSFFVDKNSYLYAILIDGEFQEELLELVNSSFDMDDFINFIEWKTLLFGEENTTYDKLGAEVGRKFDEILEDYYINY